MSQRATDEGAGRTVRDRGLPLLARAYPTSSCISVMDDYAAHKRAEVRDWPPTPASLCTSLPPQRPGSTWSRCGFASAADADAA
jgi:hypothetical protein